MTGRILALAAAAALITVTAQPMAAAAVTQRTTAAAKAVPVPEDPRKVEFARIKADILAQIKKTQACIEASADFADLNACGKAYARPAAQPVKPAVKKKR